jgi:membrane-bound ClpP family serine protease
MKWLRRDNLGRPARLATVAALDLTWVVLAFAVFLAYQLSVVLALVMAVLVYQLWPIMHELVTDLTRLPAFPSAGRSHLQDSRSGRRELAALIGREGVTASLLCPGGHVEIEGVRYHALADRTYLEAGTPVKVNEVKQGTLIVMAKRETM